jgi:nucleoside-diphosphate-sugar epimerase
LGRRSPSVALSPTRPFLVTGAGGFIGRHLLRELDRTGRPYEVVRREQLRWPEDLSALDLRPYAAVLHLANAPVKQSSPEASIERDNVEPVRRLLEAAGRAGGICGFVFVTSQSAREHSESRYGRMKWRIERLLSASRTPSVVLRPGLVVGSGAQGLFARIASIVRRSPVVPLVGTGGQLIQPVDVRTVVDALIRAGSSVEAHAGRTYALALPPLPFKDFLARIGAVLGKKPLFVPAPTLLVDAGLAALERLMEDPPVSRASLRALLEMEAIDGREAEALGLRYPSLDETLQAAFSEA